MRGPSHRQRASVQGGQSAIKPRGYKKAVEFRDETHSLRLREARKCSCHPTGFQIDHFNRVFCQRR